MTARGCDPVLHLPHTLGQPVANLVDPESLDVPAEFDQTLIPKLVSQAQLTSPAAVIALSVDLDVQAPVSYDDREVQIELFDSELQNRTQPRLIKRSVKQSLPV